MFENPGILLFFSGMKQKDCKSNCGVEEKISFKRDSFRSERCGKKGIGKEGSKEILSF